MEKIRFTRKELYDIVWKEPVVVLSRKFGISVAGLRQICVGMNIPMPPTGYWIKMQKGKQVSKTKLPVRYAGSDEVILKPRLKKHAIQQVEEAAQRELEKRWQSELTGFIDLIRLSTRWQQVVQLREYLDAMETQTIWNNKFTEDFQKWLTWAREKADWYDPLIEREDKWLKDGDRNL
jgi:hypothetical protein